MLHYATVSVSDKPEAAKAVPNGAKSQFYLHDKTLATWLVSIEGWSPSYHPTVESAAEPRLAKL